MAAGVLVTLGADARPLNTEADKAIAKVQQLKRKVEQPTQSGPKIRYTENSKETSSFHSEVDAAEVERLVRLKSHVEKEGEIRDHSVRTAKASLEQLNEFDKSRFRTVTGTGLSTDPNAIAREQLANAKFASKQMNERWLKMSDVEKKAAAAEFSDPDAFFAAMDKKQQLRKAEKEGAAREIEEAKRQDKIAKEHARSWHDQQRDQIAAFRSHQAAKSSLLKKGQQEADSDFKAWSRQQKLVQQEVNEVSKALEKAAKPTSMLGGAAKMFAGYLTADFLVSQSRETIAYARHVTDLGKSFNMSTTDVQALDKSVTKHGLNLNQVDMLLKSLNKNRINALSGYEPLQAEAYKQLGFTEEMLKKARPMDFLKQLDKAAQSMPAEQFNAALMRVGEESAFHFNTAFQDGLVKTMDSVKASGNVMTEGMIASWQQMGNQWATIAQTLGASLRSMLQPIVYIATNLTEQLISIPQMIGSVTGGGFSGLVQGWKDAWSLKGGDPVSGMLKGLKDGMAEFMGEQDKKKSTKNNFIQRAEIAQEERKLAAEAEAKFERSIAKMSPQDREAARNRRDEILGSGDSANLSLKNKIEETKHKKKVEEEEKHARQMADIKEDLADKDFKNSLIGLSPDEKRLALVAERKRMLDQINAMPHDTFDQQEKKEKRKKDLKALEGDMLSEAERENKDEARFSRISRNALEQIGGSFGNSSITEGPEIAAMNASVRSEEHLREIREIMKKQNSRGGNTDY